jgi:hypothetical protein
VRPPPPHPDRGGRMNNDESPELDDELRRIADARIAKVRHRNRIRAALRVARDVGLQRRHAEKLAHNQDRREEHES